MRFVMINITFPNATRENYTSEAQTVLSGPELRVRSFQTLPLSFSTDGLCAFTLILSLNEYANLLSMWKSPATDYKENKEETLWIPLRLFFFLLVRKLT